MNKTYTKLWLIVAIMGLMCPTFAQKYSIQLGAFPESIAPSYFSFSGFSNVNHQLNRLQFHQYTWGEFDQIESAEEQLKLLRAQSSLHQLTNLKIIPQTIDDTAIPADQPKNNIPNKATDFQLFSRFIAFNKDNLSLQKNDVRKLEEIRDILGNNPQLKLRIIATNNTGELNAQKQSTATNIIKNFLLANHIPAYRVKILSSPQDNNKERSIQKIASDIPPIIMTLVDLKEEIVLDRFGADQLFVKDRLAPKINNVLE